MIMEGFIFIKYNIALSPYNSVPSVSYAPDYTVKIVTFLFKNVEIIILYQVQNLKYDDK